MMLAGAVDSLDAIQHGNSTFEQISEVILGQGGNLDEIERGHCVG